MEDKTADKSPEDHHFAEVVLPLFLPNTLTYSIPPTFSGKIIPGIRVDVQLGKSKRYAGIVFRLHNDKPSYPTKAVIQPLDEIPVVGKNQLRLWQWISDYYCCTLGEVMIAALPAHLKLTSESILQRNAGDVFDYQQLNDREYLLAEALELKDRLTMTEVQQIIGSTNHYAAVKGLVEKGIATVWENMKESFKTKTEDFVILAPEYRNETQLEALLNEWRSAPKQLDVLLAYLHFEKTEGSVSRKALLTKTGSTPAVLKGLVAKNILLIENREVDRLIHGPKKIEIDFEFTVVQQEAFDRLKQSLDEKNVTLLHGVTGSGKTLFYIQLMADAIRAGKQCLYLLPEIALTSQIVRKLQQRLGGHVSIYHSRFNANEKLELWKKVSNGEISVIIGARSALFLPFLNLDLIIIDEEHDASFKQQEPPPRYHARDTAIMLSQFEQVKVILGSATPAVETFFNAKEKKYGYVRLDQRYGELELPEVRLVDLKKLTEAKKGKIILSDEVLVALENALKKKKQSIVFQNRRGFTPYQQCRTCGWIPRCQHCDVSLTLHKSTRQLHCHYCGSRYSVPSACGSCGRTEFMHRKFGTEQLEELLEASFPKAHVARMDTDSIRGKFSHERIIRDFEAKRIDILTGTQMVVKGLDFEDVSLVVVPDGDGLFRFSDFRSSERGFQMIEQVSGRAGRKNEKGLVYLQVFDMQNPLLPVLQSHDYHAFYEREIAIRREFFYPPFSRLIRIQCRHSQEAISLNSAVYLSDMLKQKFAGYVNGPYAPPVAKIRNQYLTDILLKLPRNVTLIREAKLAIREKIYYVNSQPAWKKVHVLVDVDPL